MVTTCEIEFENNPHKVVYAGQLLRGSVRLTLTNEKHVRGAYMHIKGKAFCRWTEGFKDDEKTYISREEYLNVKMYLVGDINGEVRLMPGTNVYPFQCVLSPNLATSVEGNFGFIRYTVRVALEYSTQSDKKLDPKVPFTVIRAINLNAAPVLRGPAMAETERTFLYCCLLCCCSSGPLRMIARTPVSGYTPGQIINLEVNVDNRSNQRIINFTVQLVKEISYFCVLNGQRSGHKKLETIVISKMHTRGCEINQTDIIHANLEVPPIPPTDTTNNIVQVQYLVRVIGSVALWHINPVLDLPIIIGSYPLQDNFPYRSAFTTSNLSPITSEPIAPQLSELPDSKSYPTQLDPNMLTAPSAPLPFPDDDPPVYEEAMHMNDPSGNIFRPKYAVFKRTTSYSNGH